MKHSESLANIGMAMGKAQGSVKTALKDSDNPHLKSKYADLGSVWAACREALSSNGLSIIQLPVSDEPGYVALETIILHESGEYIANTARTPAKDPKGQETAQSVGSAITYLRRYALSAALGIVADIDDDGHSASQPPPARGQQQPRPAAVRNHTAPAPSGKPPAGLTINNTQANSLHARLGAILSGTKWDGADQKEFAGEVLGFKVGSFTDLTMAEAKTIQERAEAEPKLHAA